MNSTARRQLLTDRLRVTRQRSAPMGVAHERRTTQDEPVQGAIYPLPESGVMPVAHDIGIPSAATSHVQLIDDSRDAAVPVTLCIFGWHNVQPGALSWVFGDLVSALRAVQAMRNAVEWVVVRGSLDHVDLERLRRRGDILAESL